MVQEHRDNVEHLGLKMRQWAGMTSIQLFISTVGKAKCVKVTVVVPKGQGTPRRRI